MARPATGQVVVRKREQGRLLRFRAYGKRRYLTLGTEADGWSRDRSQVARRPRSRRS
jgi:hypothetical protein